MCGKTAHYAVVLPSASQRGFVTRVKIPSSRWFKGIGRRLVSAANLLLEISAGAPKRLRLFPEQPEGGQAAAVRKGCERGNNKSSVAKFS